MPATVLAQSNWRGIQPGVSKRADVQRVAGAPVQAITDTLAEYKSTQPGDRAFVQYSATGVVERVEITCAAPLEHAAALRTLGLSGNPEVTKPNSRGKTEEFYGAGMVVLTLGAVGVQRYAFYSRDLFEASGGKVGGAVTDISRTNPRSPPVPPAQDQPAGAQQSPAVGRGGDTVTAMQPLLARCGGDPPGRNTIQLAILLASEDGANHAGQLGRLMNLISSGEVSLRAVAAPDPQITAALKQNGGPCTNRIYPAAEPLLQDRNVDAVLILGFGSDANLEKDVGGFMGSGKDVYVFANQLPWNPGGEVLRAALKYSRVLWAGSTSGDDLDRFFQSVRTRQPQPR